MKYSNKSTLDDLQMTRQGYLDHFAKESNLTNVASLPLGLNLVLSGAIGNTTTRERSTVLTPEPFALFD